MNRTGSRQGAALLMALVVVILLEGLAALTLAAATSRVHLVAANRDALEGRAVVGHALAAYRIDGDPALHALVDGESLVAAGQSPLPAWQVVMRARRRGGLIVLSAEAVHRDAGGRRRASRRATLLLAYHPADTLQVISTRPRW
jgi:hypothetical protein